MSLHALANQNHVKTSRLEHNKYLMCIIYPIQNEHGVNTCPMNVTSRLAFNIIDILIGYFPDITPVEGVHYPFKDTELEINRRITVLKLFKRPGYENLEGFKDSIDFSN